MTCRIICINVYFNFIISDAAGTVQGRAESGLHRCDDETPPCVMQDGDASHYFLLIIPLLKPLILARGAAGQDLVDDWHEQCAAGRVAPADAHAVGRLDVKHVRLIFWDLGGQRDLQSLWDKVARAACSRHMTIPQYYAECHGVIYVVDASDQARLDESKAAFRTAAAGTRGVTWCRGGGGGPAAERRAHPGAGKQAGPAGALQTHRRTNKLRRAPRL